MNETPTNPNNTNESNEKRSFPVRRAIAAGAAILAGAGIVGAAVESNSNPEPRTTQADKEPAPAPQDVLPGSVLTDAPQPRRVETAHTQHTEVSTPAETTAVAPIEVGHTGEVKKDKEPTVPDINHTELEPIAPPPAPNETEGVINRGPDAMPDIPLPTETSEPTPVPTPEQPQQ